MDAPAEAFDRYGEAAILDLLVTVLPDVVGAASAPLSAVDKMTVISTDGAADGDGGLDGHPPRGRRRGLRSPRRPRGPRARAAVPRTTWTTTGTAPVADAVAADGEPVGTAGRRQRGGARLRDRGPLPVQADRGAPAAADGHHVPGGPSVVCTCGAPAAGNAPRTHTTRRCRPQASVSVAGGSQSASRSSAISRSAEVSAPAVDPLTARRSTITRATCSSTVSSA